jgi:CheY-like chemotaxis protein
MPVMDGVEAARRIRQLPPPTGAVPIIAMTADAMSGARQRYLDAGMQNYISKPFQPEHLVALVQEMLRSGSNPGTSG